MVVRIHDFQSRGAKGYDVPWGRGVGKTAAFLKEVHHLGIHHTVFGLDYPGREPEAMEQMTRCLRFFNNVTLELTKQEA